MKMLQHYLEEFERIGVHTNPAWAQQQKLALQRFLDKGFPTIKDERWRYIARSPFLQMPFKVETTQATPDIEAIKRILPPLKAPNNLRFICVNGRFYLPDSALLPEGLKVEALSNQMLQGSESLLKENQKAIELGNAFHALNTIFSKEGLVITVADHCKIEPTLEIWYVLGALEAQDPKMVCARHHFEVGENSEVNLIEAAITLPEEQKTSTAFMCANTFSTMTLHEGAKVNWAQSIDIVDSQSYIAQLAVQQKKDSVFCSESLVLGSGLMRHTLSVDLCEQGAVCDLRGLTAVRRQHQVDHQIFVDHQADHTQSHMHYRGIADERGKASFGGEVSAQQGVHKMSSHQGNYNLLLSDDAEIDTRPRLALWADDIECTHGATVGALDEEALFYLEARGIPQKTARLMLIQAFGEAILELMPLLKRNQAALPKKLSAFMQHNIAN